MAEHNKKISIIIPVYNEETTVSEILKTIRNVNYGRNDFEMIIVNDGSKDNTQKVLERINDRKIKVFHKENGGKGSAVIEGLKHVTGDIVVIQDADLEYNPNDIPTLVEPIDSGRTKVIYGSRFLGSIEYMPWSNRLANWLLTTMNNVFYSQKITDSCTCYKILDNQLIQSLELKDSGFDICHEITSKLVRRGIKIIELPISYSKARSSKEGKKANWLNLIKSINAVIRYRILGDKANATKK